MHRKPCRFGGGASFLMTTMQPDTSAVPIQPCKHCGTGAPVDVHFCPRCDKILTLGRHGDYFAFFGLPRKLGIDDRDLEQRFRDMSRQFHPDFFYNSSPAERLASLERSSYLNDAFRTLRDPIMRVEYLMKVEGVARKESRESSATLPPGLLVDVFELNEEIGRIQDLRRAGAPAREVAPLLEAARRPVEEKLAEHDHRLADLSAAWDRQFDAGDPSRRATLDEIRMVLLERSYLTNLLVLARREEEDEGTSRP
jgi:molecular chaperone HscB